ncbi:MAG: hypothetical protein H0Z35_11645 [Thermoanaerobacteraceae bacterium]|nr:hypothetical protein [Thermoanaerobacteraceae bacterium]
MQARLTHDNLTDLFEQVFSLKPDKTSNFALYRFYHLVEQHPVQVLEVLFFQYYWRNQAVDYLTLKRFLKKHAPAIYPAILKFTVHLERSYLLACLDKKFFSVQVRFLGQLRHLIKDILTNLQGRSYVNTTKIAVTLRNMKHTDDMVLQLKENVKVPFECVLVLENMEPYLRNADSLADLPQFRCVYFAFNDLKNFAMQIENNNWSPFLYKHLEQLLTAEKREQIRQVLKHLIENHTVPGQVKQAFVLYMTLPDDIPWHKHPFIKRLVYNSYWYGKVHNTKTDANVSRY